jgi:hypothetical protein
LPGRVAGSLLINYSSLVGVFDARVDVLSLSRLVSSAGDVIACWASRCLICCQYREKGVKVLSRD